MTHLYSSAQLQQEVLRPALLQEASFLALLSHTLIYLLDD